MKVSCLHCRFCEQIDDEQGECHRYPPRQYGDDLCDFPTVCAVDWCGEFQPAGLHGNNDGFVQWDVRRLKIGDGSNG